VKIKKQIKLLLLLLTITTINLLSQNVVQVWPGQNRLNVPADTVISIQFDTDINPSTLNNNTIVVHASQTGLHQSSNITYNGGSRTVTFDPDDDFFVGERVNISLTSDIQNTTGDTLAPYLFSFTVKVESGSGLFYDTSLISGMGSSSQSLFSADFDLDNDMDIATIYGDEILVIMNNGDGTFGSFSEYQTGDWPRYIFSSDFNSDGYMDLVTANENSDDVSILINNGNGTFGIKNDYMAGDSPNSVFANDFNSDGFTDLAVGNVLSNSVSILLNNGDGTFATKTDYSVGTYPRAVFSADFDLDGSNDLAIANGNSDDVSILINNGNGIFGARSDYPVGDFPRNMYSTDLNDDGYMDLAVANLNGIDNISILLNNGNGTFQPSVNYPSGNTPYGIYSTDMDADGDMDLITPNSGSDSISVLLNSGGGTFNSKNDFPAGQNPRSIFSTDFDLDGDLDIATINSNSGEIIILFNSNSASDIFIDPTQLNFGSVKIDSIKSMQFMVYNHGADSTLEISDIQSSSSDFLPNITSVSILPGDSSIITVDFTPSIIKIYNDSLTIFSNDPDQPIKHLYVSGFGNAIVSHSPYQNEINISKDTNISITFNVDINQSTLNASTFMVHGMLSGFKSGVYNYNNGNRIFEFNPDNEFALGEIVNVIVTSGIQTLLGIPIIPYEYSFIVGSEDGSGRFYNKISIPIFEPISVISSDIDSDGDFDLLVGKQSNDSIFVYKNNGQSSFDIINKFYAGGMVHKLFSTDIENDGDMDLVVTHWAPHGLSVLYNSGTGDFLGRADYQVGTLPMSDIFCSDLNMDGFQDVIIVGREWLNSITSVLFNNGDGTLGRQTDYLIGGIPESIFVTDVDLDGDMDLVATLGGFGLPQKVAVLLNNGFGYYYGKKYYSAGDRPYALFAADLNNNSYVDLAVTDENSADISVLLNDGFGRFNTHNEYPVGDSPYSLFLSDFDADGDIDMASANASSDNISILPNNGDGTFGIKSDFPIGDNPRSLFSADFDLDGDMDIVTANLSSNEIAILLNNTRKADISLSTYWLDFGTIKLDSVKTISFSIYNFGVDSMLQVNNIISTDTSFNTNITNTTILPGDSSIINVTFTPSTGKIYIDSLKIYSNDAVDPEIVLYLRGIGSATSLHTPSQNEIDVSKDINITIEFAQEMNQNTINDSTFIVQGLRTGLIDGTYNYDVGTKTAVFNPDNDFIVGEHVNVLLTKGIQNVYGDFIAPYQFSFTIETDEGSGIFLEKTNYAAENGPISVFSADYNSDNYLDIAVTNSSSNLLSIYLNNGDGTFSPKTDYATDNSPYSVHSADFNSDGYIDISTSNLESANISIFLNNGNGTFATKSDYNTGSGPISIYSSDLDSDGDMDIVTANIATYNISIVLNNGDGTFSSNFDYPVGNTQNYISSTDLDNDGDLDLVIAKDGYSNNLSLLFNNGAAYFGSQADYTVGPYPESIYTTDLDSDGDIDIATASVIYDFNQISVLINNGDGTFSSSIDIPVGETPQSVFSTDIDADGDMDIATANQRSNDISFLLNHGNASFTTHQEFLTGIGPSCLFSSDFDNDGDMDIVTSNVESDNISVLFNSNRSAKISISNNQLNFGTVKVDSSKELKFTVYNFGVDSTLKIGSIISSNPAFIAMPDSIHVLPLDSVDIVVVFTPTNMVLYSDSLIINSNDPNQSQKIIYVSGLGGTSVGHSPSQNASNVSKSTDITIIFNEDIDPATINESNLVIYGLRSGFCGGTINYNSNDYTIQFFPDFDYANGDLVTVVLTSGIKYVSGDSIVPYQFSFTIETEYGSGIFSEQVRYPAELSPISIFSTDVDSDNDLDIVTANIDSSSVSVFLNNNKGIFNNVNHYVVGNNPRSVYCADLDNDRAIDIAVIDDIGISLLFNNGDGSFGGISNYTNIIEPRSVAAVDIDSDGDIDLVTTNGHENNISILFNSGDGIFNTNVEYPTDQYPYSTCIADLDLDGDLDLASTNYNSDNVTILLNDGNGVFSSNQNYLVNYRPRMIYSADIDLDNDMDLLITLGSSADSIVVLYNNGDAVFNTKYSYEVGNYPSSVVSSDVNSDGTFDIIVGNRASDSLSVLLNNGNGSFGQKRDLATGDDPRSIFSSDFDSDGDMDLAVTNRSSNDISMFFNLSSSPDLKLDRDSLDFAIVKCYSKITSFLIIKNESGLNQLNVNNITSSNPSVFSISKTSGIIDIQDSMIVNVTFSPSEVKTYTDSLTIYSDDPEEPTVTLYLQGTGGPTVVSSVPLANAISSDELVSISAEFNTTMQSSSYTSSSFRIFGEVSGNQDGVITYINGTNTVLLDPDSNFVFGENVQVILTDSIKSNPDNIPLAGGYSWKFFVTSLFGIIDYNLDTTKYIGGNNPFAISSGDFNLDGFTDFAFTNSGDNTVTVYKNDTNGNFNISGTYSVGSNPQGIEVADINADGYIDIITTNNMDNNVSVLINLNNGTFSSATNFDVGFTPRSLITGDIDNDGNLDIVTGNITDDNISILYNDGNGEFYIDINIDAGDGPGGIILEDLDTDGDMDIAVSNLNSNNITVLVNNGDNFVNDSAYATGDLPNSLIAQDIDKDFDVDLVTVNTNSNDISVLFNDGNGIFSNLTNFPAGTQPLSLYANDFDSDEDIDLVVVNFGSEDVMLLQNDGNGNFTNYDTIAVGNNPRDIVGIDITGKVGIIDLAVVHSTGQNAVSILKNDIGNNAIINISLNTSGEQTGNVKINHNIYNYHNNNIGLLCQYRLSDTTTWANATVSGDTSALPPSLYQGTITWLSDTDLPGVDIEEVWFKIQPYSDNLGISDSIVFHLDNNQIPIADLQCDSTELKQTITLNSYFYDMELDTISIICNYKLQDSTTWENPTILSDTSGLRSDSSLANIIWESLSDIPNYSGYLWFKVQPFDNDPGIADSIYILVDNLGVPVLLSLSQPLGEQSGDIAFDYIINDDESDLISLKVQYSLDSLNWINASVSGDTSNINPQNYQGSITWHSGIDLAGLDDKTVWIKIIPRDANIGVSLTTTAFHVDNNDPPLISINSINTPESGLIDIPYQLQDAENDTINILTSYRISSSNWQSAIDTSITQNNYQGILGWSSVDNMGFGEFPSVQIQLIPMDNDTGTGDISNPFDIYNYAGDYSGDIQIDYDDLIQFALAWGSQNVSKEIGPATGTPPLLIPQPDGVIDFEDLMVLVQQWNWSYDNPGMLTKVIAEGNKNNITINKPQTIYINTYENETVWTRAINPDQTQKILNDENKHLLTIEQSEYDPWSNEFADNINISIDTTAKLLGMYIEIDYDPKILTMTEIDNQLLKDQNGFTFKTSDEQTGKLILNSIVLNDIDKLSKITGQLFNLNIQSKETAKTSIEYSWQIHNQSGTIISSGKNSIDMTVYETIPKSYALYQNFPNPFNPKTTIRYQLPVDSKVKLEVYNILGEKVITLVNEDQAAGYYSKVWDINREKTYASGIYIYRLTVSGKDNSRYVKSKKMMLLK